MLEKVSSYRKSAGRPSKIPSLKQQIRSAILQERFGEQGRLPSIEELAREFRVAQVTAKRAVDELAAEGWLESRHGVGTFVSVRRSNARVLLTAPRKSGSEIFLSTETLEAFQAQYPHVEIALSSEPRTDIVVTNSYALVVDAVRGQELQSLDDLRTRFKRDAWSLLPQMHALASHHDELFALPLRADLVVLQVNPELCPRDMTFPRPYLSWEQYRDILDQGRQDRDGDGFPECYGAFSKLALYEWLLPFWQRGGSLAERESFFSGEAFGALDELWRMHHVDRTLPIEMQHTQRENANKVIGQRFFDRQVAMRWIPSVEIFDRTPFPSTLLLPRFGSFPRQEVYGILLGIHRDCAHPDVALAFLDFCYQRFIRNNPEYPFALSPEHRNQLRQVPGVHRLLQEGLVDASEPLREGIPQRTWAIEREVFDWFRLRQNRAHALKRLHEHWDRWDGNAIAATANPSSLLLPWSEVSPLASQLF